MATLGRIDKSFEYVQKPPSQITCWILYTNMVAA
jgi:hypothetical protein